MDFRELIKITNANFNVMSLLQEAGVYNPSPGAMVFCPFHEDKAGGKRSAKIHKDGLYCFSERKSYKSYDILKWLDHSDKEIEQALLSNPNLNTDIPDAIKINLLTPEILSIKQNFIFNRIKFNEYIGQVLPKMSALLQEFLNARRQQSS
jgi:hypothetical protein